MSVPSQMKECQIAQSLNVIISIMLQIKCLHYTHSMTPEEVRDSKCQGVIWVGEGTVVSANA